MIWRNEEQYADYTAGEAMLRVLGQPRERAVPLDDEGCFRLAAAVVRQAAEDLRVPWRAKEAEAFFHSEYFRLLTGLDGGRILRRVRKEMDRE